MKKTIIVVCILLVAVLFSACGVNDIAKLASQAAAGQESESVSSEEIPSKEVSAGKNDKDNVTVSNSSGSYSAGENLKWPAEHMGNLPALEGNIVGALTSAETSAVSYSGVTKAQAEKYVAGLKTLGYEGMDASDKSSLYFSGTDKDGAVAIFQYGYDTQEAVISYTPAAK